VYAMSTERTSEVEPRATRVVNASSCRTLICCTKTTFASPKHCDVAASQPGATFTVATAASVEVTVTFWPSPQAAGTDGLHGTGGIVSVEAPKSAVTVTVCRLRSKLKISVPHDVAAITNAAAIARRNGGETPTVDRLVSVPSFRRLIPKN